MEIWLTKDGDRILLPITPLFKIESANSNSVENLNEIGEVNIAGRQGLRSTTLESYFPRDKEPYSYVEKLSRWQKENEPIRLIITETPHNFECLIESFSSSEDDGSSDVYFSISLKEYRRFEMNKAPIVSAGETKRFNKNQDIPKALLTVGKYDTPWTMAKKIYGDGEKFKKILKAGYVVGKVLRP